MFELKGKMFSARQKMGKLVRLFTSQSKEILNVSPSTPLPEIQYRQANLPTESARGVDSQIAHAFMYSQMLNKPR